MSIAINVQCCVILLLLWRSQASLAQLEGDFEDLAMFGTASDFFVLVFLHFVL